MARRLRLAPPGSAGSALRPLGGRRWPRLKAAPAGEPRLRLGSPPRRRLPARVGRGALVVLAGVVVFVAVQALRPAPSPRLLPLLPASYRVPGTAPRIPWPTTGEAALAVGGVGPIGSSGGDTPLPLASVAKIMTAYVVLHDHPLALGAEGPSLTVTPADVATYQADLASGQSVVAVKAGEVLTERQALEALLLPSGNNIATMLAVWDAGSVPAFVHKMNATASALHLRHTHYAGPSGLNPASAGSAPDQVRLAEAAMRIPAFAEIVRMAQATLPVAGVVYNVNALVGHDGIVGVKTGSTPEAGSSLVFAADRTVAGRPVQIFGAVLGQMGATPLATTFAETRALLAAVTAGLGEATVIGQGSPAARLAAPWGASAAAVTTGTVRFLSWPGMVVRTRLEPRPLPTSLPASAPVGRLEVRLGDEQAAVGLVASRSLPGPPLSFRLRNL